MSVSDSIDKFLEKFKIIQEKILDFLEEEENIEENFYNLKQLLEDTKIRECQHEIRQFLHFLIKVANNHHHASDFFKKIDLILQLFKDNINKYKNDEIFHLFKSNKRILLFLIEEKILTVDEFFVKQIIDSNYLAKKYPQYFAPEIKPFSNENWFPKYDKYIIKTKFVEDIMKELPDDFYEKRKIGENESYLCELIRKDSAEEFIAYVNRNNIPFNKTIPLSIYETNSLLIKKRSNTTLIEYAAFFGSIQIFTYLKYQNVKLKSSLWIDVIHSKNAELIHILEENHIDPIISVFKNHIEIKEISYKGCFKESIKCHHNAIANYFLNNHQQNENENSNEIIKYYNFAFFQKEGINESIFCHLCNYDYYILVKALIASQNVDINSKAIQKHIFQ